MDLNGKSLQECPVNASVPQGSIPNTTFFLLEVNNLDDVIYDMESAQVGF